MSTPSKIIKKGGELHSTERGRFARISVEINLHKKLIPRIKIRNRTYLIEYEGLSLICFSCRQYGHHKDLCPGTNQHIPNQNLMDNNSSSQQLEQNNNIANVVKTNQSEDQTFGSWMVAKKNPRSRTDNRQHIREQRGKKSTRPATQPQGTDSQKLTLSNGSRFAFFETEEVETEEGNADLAMRDSSEEIIASAPLNLIQEEVSKPMMIEENQQDHRGKTGNQQGHLNSNNSGASINLLKSKGIMERFVKPRGGMETKSVGSLKGNYGGTFKPPKTKKSNFQWGITKVLINTEEIKELEKTLSSQKYSQEAVDDIMLKNKPPDSNLSLNSGGINVHLVKQTEESAKKGSLPFIGS